MFGSTEIILIVLVVFLLFGASRLPKLAKSLGQSRKAFKEGLEEAEKEFLGEEEKELESVEVPKISAVKDEDLATEMRRRSEVEQS